MKLNKIKIQCEIEVPFYSLGSKKEDKQVEKDIKKWVKAALINECSFIPFYQTKTELDETVECCSKKAKIKIK